MDIPDKYREDFAIIKATAEQIESDLKIDELKIHLSGNHHIAFNEIKQQLIPFIGPLYKKSIHSFMALLYRVDIREKDFKLAISKKNDFEGEIAELIIRRAFQKVLSKRYFSDKSE